MLLQPHVREEEKLVDIELLLYPRKKNSMELGIGFAPDTGPSCPKLVGQNPGLIAEAIRFRIINSLRLCAKAKLEATYKMPLLKKSIKLLL